MEKLRFEVRINAPAQTVWATMLDDATYREWTSAFNETGSYYEGDWNQGSEIRFLGPEEEGSVGGMIAIVEESRPHEFISLRYLGQIVRGEDDRTSDAAKEFIGAHENYSFTESDGVTTVEVELESEDDWADMLNEAWPVALAKLKDLAEARS
ncbi:ATPase [Arthrobacter sp. AFG7.2]|uniref:SRPBCC family protein n=1 Tax=Arthrobacter sp. AFG7.2 TaxID=1688693 RepID=UPI000C9DE254|nr:SRPBCC domain-containing protein [Arthrobacter sp. AFG7.2]PNI08108.1 ATPase [Arthrobacter sp. AFG7.2]